MLPVSWSTELQEALPEDSRREAGKETSLKASHPDFGISTDFYCYHMKLKDTCSLEEKL